jgi:predicted dehydrogenase
MRAARVRAAATSAVRTVGRLAGRAREPSYAAALGRFVAAVRAGRSAQPDLEDGYRSLRAIVEAETHAETRGAAAAPVAGPR